MDSLHIAEHVDTVGAGARLFPPALSADIRAAQRARREIWFLRKMWVASKRRLGVRRLSSGDFPDPGYRRTLPRTPA